MKIPALHKLFLKADGKVSTDTRKIEKDSIFFALKGENFNANEFANEALLKGASYVVIDEEEYKIFDKSILVPNVMETLQQLANFHRRFLNLPIIALTGSNGKTTTKELINVVLSSKYKITATKGNLNNHIGVPLTLLSMTKETEIGIVEMGANHPGEIAFLCNIAEPDYGYITNFGKAHLEGFGSLEGVKKAKSELYDFLKSKNSLLFLNLDDETQRLHKEYSKTSTFAVKHSADVNYEIETTDPFVILKHQNQKFTTRLIGNYNAPNVAAAITIGLFFNVPVEKISESLASYEPQNNRSQIISLNGNKIILDAYNANPTSMQAALESFDSNRSENKIIILGDMFEMGNSAEEEHQNIVNILQRIQFQKAYLVGENFFKTKIDDDRIVKSSTLTQLKEIFDIKKQQSKLILVKGSRGMALEKILEG